MTEDKWERLAKQLFDMWVSNEESMLDERGTGSEAERFKLKVKLIRTLIEQGRLDDALLMLTEY